MRQEYMCYLTFAISACFILSHDAKKIKLSQLWGDNLDPFIFTNFPLIVYVCHCVGIWGETEKQDWLVMFLEPQSARTAIGERKIRTAFLHMFRLSLVNTLSSI